MNAEDLLVRLNVEHDKIVSEADAYLNGMLERYKHDLGAMVEQHNSYISSLADRYNRSIERQTAAMMRRNRK